MSFFSVFGVGGQAGRGVVGPLRWCACTRLIRGVLFCADGMGCPAVLCERGCGLFLCGAVFWARAWDAMG